MCICLFVLCFSLSFFLQFFLVVAAAAAAARFKSRLTMHSISFFFSFSLSRSSKIKWNYSQGRTDKMEYIMHTHTHDNLLNNSEINQLNTRLDKRYEQRNCLLIV